MQGGWRGLLQGRAEPSGLLAENPRAPQLHGATAWQHATSTRRGMSTLAISGLPMTIYSINIMWAIVLFGVLLWSTAGDCLNAALRPGMRRMSMVLSYGVLAWMLADLPVREAATTWLLFAAFGGVLSFAYELWARRKYAGTGRIPRSLVQPLGLLLWPAMIPNAVGMMFNDAGILPADERAETHAEDAQRITGEMPTPTATPKQRRALYDTR